MLSGLVAPGQPTRFVGAWTAMHPALLLLLLSLGILLYYFHVANHAYPVLALQKFL